ncbi:hypothetical protein KC338_g253 [Hortaea werneckii]|nr:hypothetical protein KC338_g253 [Hortaea werneckii]
MWYYCYSSLQRRADVLAQELLLCTMLRGNSRAYIALYEVLLTAIRDTKAFRIAGSAGTREAAEAQVGKRGYEAKVRLCLCHRAPMLIEVGSSASFSFPLSPVLLTPVTLS